MVRQGILDNPPKTPITMGFECAGEVEAVGGDTTGFKVFLSTFQSHTTGYSMCKHIPRSYITCSESET
jgi:D-arabinose 1-dehydrogenase-like Zn-dependent alcohol dehydrogenase